MTAIKFAPTVSRCAELSFAVDRQKETVSRCAALTSALTSALSTAANGNSSVEAFAANGCRKLSSVSNKGKSFSQGIDGTLSLVCADSSFCFEDWLV